MTQEEINIRISEGQINGRLEKIKDDLYSNWSQYPGEPEVCSHFGCGKKLTITERLYGKKCIDHQNIKPGPQVVANNG